MTESVRVKRYERTFKVRADVKRTWRAMTEPSELEAWHGHAETFEARPGGRVLFVNPGWDDVAGAVIEVQPQRLLRWRTVEGPFEFRETLEPAEDGTRVTIVETGPAASPVELERSRRGWDEAIADLILYLDHGVAFPRHMAPLASLGAETEDTDAGIVVTKVLPNGFAISAGLERGDVIVAMGGAPVFGRSDLLVLLREHSPGASLDVTFVRRGRVGQARAPLSG